MYLTLFTLTVNKLLVNEKKISLTGKMMALKSKKLYLKTQ